MTIAGLPLHILVVHGVVVFVPLTVLASIALAVLPRWRWLSRWPTAVMSVISVGLAFLATTSGESLEESRPQLRRIVHEHSERGGVLANLTIVLAVVVLAAAYLLPGPTALESGRGLVASRVALADKVLPVLLVLVAVVVAVQLVLTGDSGARAVWG